MDRGISAITGRSIWIQTMYILYQRFIQRWKRDSRKVRQYARISQMQEKVPNWKFHSINRSGVEFQIEKNMKAVEEPLNQIFLQLKVIDHVLEERDMYTMSLLQLTDQSEARAKTRAEQSVRPPHNCWGILKAISSYTIVVELTLL